MSTKPIVRCGAEDCVLKCDCRASGASVRSWQLQILSGRLLWTTALPNDGWQRSGGRAASNGASAGIHQRVVSCLIERCPPALALPPDRSRMRCNSTAQARARPGTSAYAAIRLRARRGRRRRSEAANVASRLAADDGRAGG